MTGNIAKNLYPNNENIVLCVGAQVMFIYNDPKRRWVNGTIGTVTDIKTHIGENGKNTRCVVSVEKTDGEVVEVEKYTWKISKYVYKKDLFERETIGSFTQMPIKLAWAMTIHKSQGKTFKKVVVDLGRGTFVHGQTYVALSRCTTLEGLVLKKRFYPSSIITDNRVRNFKVAKQCDFP
jgi:ATP-dependent DNA helicase PIF1